MTGPVLAHAGPPSAAQPLFILAMGHRDSFGQPLFGVTDDTPTDRQLPRLTPDREATIRRAVAS